MFLNISEQDNIENIEHSFKDLKGSIISLSLIKVYTLK